MLHLIGISISEETNILTFRCCFYYIRDLRHIGPIFLFQSSKSLVQHSLLRGLVTATLFVVTLYPSVFIASKCIECVQNCIARVVTRSPRFSHSVPLLKSLHWYPVKSRIFFKDCTIAYQTLYSGEPSYLFSMLSLAPNPRELRSSGLLLLSVPRVKIHAWDSWFYNCPPYSLEFTLWTC